MMSGMDDDGWVGVLVLLVVFFFLSRFLSAWSGFTEYDIIQGRKHISPLPTKMEFA